MTKEGKRVARRFMWVCWAAAGMLAFFTPLAVVTIPAAIVWGVFRLGQKRRAAQVRPTRFVPERQYNQIPVELRGRM